MYISCSSLLISYMYCHELLLTTTDLHWLPSCGPPRTAPCDLQGTLVTSMDNPQWPPPIRFQSHGSCLKMLVVIKHRYKKPIVPLTVSWDLQLHYIKCTEVRRAGSVDKPTRIKVTMLSLVIVTAHMSDLLLCSYFLNHPLYYCYLMNDRTGVRSVP